MTGEPSFTFRNRDDAPACDDCGDGMTFLATREGPFGDRDIYGCGDCGTRFIDRWTF